MADFSFDALRRFPDVEAPNLFAHDASDRLILAESAAVRAASARGEIVVIGDRYGALTLGTAADGATALRVHQDSYSGELALAANAERVALTGSYRSFPLGPELLDGARLVLLQLPRSLDALDAIARLIARHADPAVTLVAGGRIKHMTIAMNGVLSRSFDTVTASFAVQKSRAIVAGSPRAVDEPEPAGEFHRELGLWICAYPLAFAGTKLDIGTRFLLDFIDRLPENGTAIDLGCGTGVIAAAVASARPGLRVIASDQSAAAVSSARATAKANGVADRIEVVRDDALTSRADASADLILLNPPFHIGATVHAGIALKLFEDAARVLRPGGELWTVWNSHLGYRPALERLVGPTEQLGRNAKFTVTVSRRRP